MERWSISVVTAPASEPLAASDLAQHCRLSAMEQAAQESLITRKLAAAREACERATGRQLITATYDLLLDEFPDESGEMGECRSILLPFPPLQSVTSITYVDPLGVTQTLSTSLYTVENAGTERARIKEAPFCIWPVTRRQSGAVTVRFVCGYGTAGSAVPDALLESILDYAAASFERREDMAKGARTRAEATWLEYRA